MLRKSLILSEDLHREVREFRFRHHFDSELAAIRALITVGLRAYEEDERELRRRAEGKVQGGSGEDRAQSGAD